MAREAVREIPREAGGGVMAHRIGHRADGTFVTRQLPPPAEAVTPELAARWLRTTYPRLQNFTALGFHPAALRPPRRRDDLRIALSGIALDANAIAGACIEALATGRTVPMKLAPRFAPHRDGARRLRYAIEYERRLPHGVRGVLRGALRRMERDMRAAAAEPEGAA